MNSAAARGYGCLAVVVGIPLTALFGGWRLALALGLVWLGGTMLIAAVVVRPGPYPVPESSLSDPEYHREVRLKRISVVVAGIALIGVGVVAYP